MIHPHEITIGSLLRTNKGEIIRVETITSKAKHRKVGYHPKDRPTYMRYARLAQCEGIELTPEILEANGFEKSSSCDYKFPYAESFSERGFYLENPLRGLYFITDHQLIPIVYVHELQRVLRCCGLFNLADNIKI